MSRSLLRSRARLLLGASCTHALLLIGTCASGCGGGAALPAPAPPVVVTASAAPPLRSVTQVAAADLPARPVPGPVAAFLLPAPGSRTLRSGAKLWALPQHKVPLVALALVFPGAGSAADPAGQAGRAHLASRVIAQGGAGTSAANFHAAIEDLGAEFSVDTYVDYMQVTLLVPREHLARGLALSMAAALRPALDASEFAREKSLWIDALRNQAKDPKALFDAATLALVHGPDHPYGHPKMGLLRSAPNVALADVRALARTWLRSDNLTIVAAGDVAEQELIDLVDAQPFGAPAGEALAALPFIAPTTAMWATPGRVYFVEKAEAAQGIVGLVMPGLQASAQPAAASTRANTVLGGSFTSRLNQELRETRGLTYGASSQFSFRRGDGMFSASAAVTLEKSVEAARALTELVQSYAASGPTDEESEKSRMLARGELIETYEGALATVGRVARSAGVAAPATYDRDTSIARDVASAADLRTIAATYMQPRSGVLVVVGPSALFAAFEKAQLGTVVRLPEPGAPAFKQLARPSAVPAGKKRGGGLGHIE